MQQGSFITFLLYDLYALQMFIIYRRPIALRSSTIGIWYNILEVLGYLAIVANVIINYTT